MRMDMMTSSRALICENGLPRGKPPSSLGLPARGYRVCPSILFVTPEFADYIKSGGLGEVAAALPRALKSGVDIRLLLPGYPSVLAAHPELRTVARIRGSSALPACEIGEVRTPDGITVYVVISPDLYAREGSPYSDAAGNEWPDNHLRFACFSRAAALIAAGLPELGWKPDLLHLNDWPCGLTPGYLAWHGVQTPTIFTIHNLAYQGIFDPTALSGLSIPQQAFQIHGLEFYGKASFLKAGLFYSTHLTTVSATYAVEITTEEFGCGLHGLLKTRAQEGHLSGILNGIDDQWPSHRGSHRMSGFDLHDWAGKHRNALAVREEFGLAVSRGPLFAIVSRLVHQKGLDLVLEAADAIVSRGGQIIVTGRGESNVEEAWRMAAHRHPDNIAVKIGFDDDQAQRIFAGSDFLLMPSRFEPCGLSQMYAQRMATLPIAHRTGGLSETVEDGVTGFLFGTPTADALLGAVERAMSAFGSISMLSAMRRAAMTQPFGWRTSARAYRTLYSAQLSEIFHPGAAA